MLLMSFHKIYNMNLSLFSLRLIKELNVEHVSLN